MLALSASNISVGPRAPIQARAMDKSDIRDFRKWHRKAALRAMHAGFDLIYQCMDRDFDIKNNLKSIPANWSNKVSLSLAKLMHVITVASLLSLGWTLDLSLVYFTGVAIALLLLIYEHSLVKADDLSKVTVAFFNVNGYIAVTIFAFTAAAILMN